MTKPYCTYNLDQVRESGLIPAARMEAIIADIESRISEPRTPDGRPITSAKLVTFPDGTMMLYHRMDHDPDGDYMRRELLAVVLTPEELKLVNDQCHNASSAAREAARFEKAEKLDSWDGWVTDGDGYWDSVESYLDERDEEDWTHSYLWVATPQQVIPDLDVDSVTEHHVTDRGHEDMTVDDLESVKELQAALDAFVAANALVVTYTMDTTRVVLLDAYIARYERLSSGIDPSQR